MTKKKRFGFKNIAHRITGFSVPIFGLSWNPPANEREIVRGLVAFMEDRRALYNDYNWEIIEYVDRSVLEVRTEITKILMACPEDENLTAPLRAMRAACRKFLDSRPHPGKREHVRYPGDPEGWQALGELRAIMGLHLARLCAAYGVDVEPDLATIFPQADEDNQQ